MLTVDESASKVGTPTLVGGARTGARRARLKEVRAKEAP
jgi:hypothetical protein